MIRYHPWRTIGVRDWIAACMWTGALFGIDSAGGVVRAEPVSIALGVLSIGMLAASYLLQKRSRAVLQDDNPPTTAVRGAFAPLVIGRRRLGPIIAWVDPEKRGTFSAPSGKRGQQSGAAIRQYGWHILCVGPAQRLHRIWVNGKIVWDHSISPQDYPSGSTISIGGLQGQPSEGTLTLYWGERDQPYDPILQAKLGFNCRFHGVFSVVWDKVLGDIPQWPLIEYEIEVAPRSALTGSSPWMNETLTDAEPGAGWACGVGGTVPKRVRVLWPTSPDADNGIRIGQVVRLSGNVATVLYAKSPVHVFVTNKRRITAGLPAPQWHLEIDLGAESQADVLNPQTPIAGDRIAPVDESSDDGANHAHVIDQLMFAVAPWGRALPRDPFDIGSLEDMGRRLSKGNEGLRANVILADGETFEAMLAAILADIGYFLSWDPLIGKNRFVPIREPEGDIPHVPSALILPPLPEVQRLHVDGRPADKLQFTFLDRDYNYRKQPLQIQDDGRATYANSQKHREVEIKSTTDAATAVKIAERRSQEELAAPTKRTIQAQGDAVDLVPGMPFTAHGVPHTQRLFAVKPNVLTAQVELHSMVDSYGVPVPTSPMSVPEGIGSPILPAEAAHDLLLAVFEPPPYVIRDRIAIAVARVRGAENVLGAHIWISTDDVTYKQVGTVRDSASGGLLAIDIPADTPPLVDELPAAVVPVGVDAVAVLEDLGGNDEAWLAGAQVALIGEEIAFLRSVTLDGGSPDTLTLDGLVRGRYGTGRRTHVVDDPIVIIQSHQIRYFSDVLMQPGKTLFVKSQPFTHSTVANLAEVHSVQVALRGKAFTPPDPLNLRTINRSNSYRAGEDVQLTWCYRSSAVPFTGAGMQPAGHPTGDSPVQGVFVLRIRDGGSPGTVLREISVGTSTTYTYPNADLVADFGGEPDFLEVELVNIQSGFSSNPIRTTIVKV